MNVSVLGCGRWGSFLAWYNCTIGHNVISFGREDSPSYLKLKNEGKNEWITLDPRIKLSCNLKQSVESADVIIISISSQGLRQFFSEITKLNYKDKVFVLCMKGIEIETGKRLTEVALECGIAKDKIAVWVGPGHIQEFLKGNPNCMVLDSYNQPLSEMLIEKFKSPLIRFYEGADIIGTEIGAASKNVMGILAGALDGLSLTAMKGALMARGSREVARLMRAMGGNELSAYGLCHLGDYETTLFSEHSHNRRFGESFIKGVPFKHLAEGVSTAQAMKRLGKKYNVELPLTESVCDMLDGGKPKDIIDSLFSRSLKKEFD